MTESFIHAASRAGARVPSQSYIGLGLLWLTACSAGVTDLGPSDRTSTSRSPLSGWWMRREIGNCINGEDWLHLNVETGAFERRFVDRNFCTTHGVSAIPGTLELRGNILSRTYGERFETDSVVVAASPPGPAGQQLPGGYQLGNRALVLGALLKNGDLRFDLTRDDTTKHADGSFVRSHSKATVTLDHLELNRLPHDCRMGVELQVQWESNLDPKSAAGTERFTLPCQVRAGPLGASIVALGFEEVGNAWSELFEQSGVWKREADVVANQMFAMFRPVLRTIGDDQGILIGAGATYQEMLSPPPDRGD